MGGQRGDEDGTRMRDGDGKRQLRGCTNGTTTTRPISQDDDAARQPGRRHGTSAKTTTRHVSQYDGDGTSAMTTIRLVEWHLTLGSVWHGWRGGVCVCVVGGVRLKADLFSTTLPSHVSAN
jgi:hypothetical protein